LTFHSLKRRTFSQTQRFCDLILSFCSSGFWADAPQSAAALIAVCRTPGRLTPRVYSPAASDLLRKSQPPAPRQGTPGRLSPRLPSRSRHSRARSAVNHNHGARVLPAGLRPALTPRRLLICCANLSLPPCQQRTSGRLTPVYFRLLLSSFQPTGPHPATRILVALPCVLMLAPFFWRFGLFWRWACVRGFGRFAPGARCACARVRPARSRCRPRSPRG
jgi:hypothetical protein